MITLYLVRHGHCFAPAEEYLQGQTDAPLTDLGIKQAEAVGERLASEAFTAIYASDLSRTLDTAQAIACRHNLPVVTSRLIREMSLGEAQGMTIPEFSVKYPEAYALWRQDAVVNRPPGAERFEDVIERCGRFLEQIKSTHTSTDKIVVVGHIGSISGMLCAAFNFSVPFYLSLSIANAGLSILDIGESARLRLFNDTCHLTHIS